MAKNFYAIKRGFDKKQNKEVTDIIVDDWYETAPLVKGYNNARYKGFDTKEEAETWLSVVDRTDAERRAKDTINKAKEEIGINNTNIHTLADEYIEVLDKLIEEYKRRWDKLATIGNLTSIVVNEVERIYKK